MDSLNVTRSESVTDLNMENGLPHPRRASTGHARNDENFISVPPKPFGIGKHIFSIQNIFNMQITYSYRCIFNNLLIVCVYIYTRAHTQHTYTRQ